MQQPEKNSHKNVSENYSGSMKKQMTHEERMELAAKLDKELDEFIDNLPRRKYEDGWPEDRWEEEMERHPFFMKSPPKPGQELHPLMEGLQALKYDPDENEPEDLATSYKEDGNFNFKYKNYRLAVISYTEGIKVKCQNKELNASLYNNRSAAHYFLKNYRSALQDAAEALKLNPEYDKALIRAANCCYEMKRYGKCIEYCDRILDKDKDNNIIVDLRNKCVKEQKLVQRNERKSDMEAKKKKKMEENLVCEIVQRRYKLEGDSTGNISIEHLEHSLPQFIHTIVHLGSSGNLIWPVVLVYPEYQVMDYIQEFSETSSFQDQLSEVFQDYPEWDKEHKYKLNNINIYVETSKKKIIKIGINNSLKDVMTKNDVIIKGGTPCFIILVKDSAAENRFLAEYQ